MYKSGVEPCKVAPTLCGNMYTARPAISILFPEMYYLESIG